MNRFLFVLFVLLFCGSCKKTEPEKAKTQLPVKFMLLPSHVVKFKQFTNRSVLRYVNATGDTIVMSADAPGHNLTFDPNTTRRGEEFSQYFTCTSSYLETFKIGYQIEAFNDSVSQLRLVSISGNLLNTNRSQDYYATYSMLQLMNSDTTEYDSSIGFNYQLLDSVNIGTRTYRKCYYLDNLHSFGWGPLSDYFYFDPFAGYIKFNTRDGKVWELIN